MQTQQPLQKIKYQPSFRMCAAPRGVKGGGVRG